MEHSSTSIRRRGEPAAGGNRWDIVLPAEPARAAQSILVALLSVAALTAVLLPWRSELGVPNGLLLYLLLILMLALTRGLLPAVVAAITSFVVLDLVFIPPYLTLTIADRDHVLALVVYLAVAVVTARLAARLQARTEEAMRESRHTAMLAELNAALIGDVTLDAILVRIAERVVTVYGAEGCRMLVRQDDELRTEAAFPPAFDTALDRTGLALAEWAIAHQQPVGRSRRGRRIVGARRSPGESGGSGSHGGDVLYLPILTANRVVGVLEVIGRPGAGAFHADDERLLMTFVGQAALAIERARLSDDAAQAAALAASDELKTALLAAVSHDLRTPLASIKAAATSLLDESVAWDAESRRELLSAIDEETDRLTLMVGNLLDLSRIEGGALRPRLDWYDLDEVIADVVQRMARRTSSHPLRVSLEPDLPLLQFDYVEIAQVLVNLIENAITHTPTGTPIEIAARRQADAVEVAVHDAGPGIPPWAQARIFERFYRGEPGSGAGSGIGLAICKGLVEAHGGRIGVESQPGAGTTFRFTLPLPVAREGEAVAGRPAEGVLV
ncbi:MAG: DUF4118 domain-containing protein [Thermomicrobiales bacterium]|nr:DUF4118 domain-containing protein [Thermomicrobiales bacterium]